MKDNHLGVQLLGVHTTGKLNRLSPDGPILPKSDTSSKFSHFTRMKLKIVHAGRQYNEDAPFAHLSREEIIDNKITQLAVQYVEVSMMKVMKNVHPKLKDQVFAISNFSITTEGNVEPPTMTPLGDLRIVHIFPLLGNPNFLIVWGYLMVTVNNKDVPMAYRELVTEVSKATLDRYLWLHGKCKTWLLNNTNRKEESHSRVTKHHNAHEEALADAKEGIWKQRESYLKTNIELLLEKQPLLTKSQVCSAIHVACQAWTTRAEPWESSLALWCSQNITRLGTPQPTEENPTTELIVPPTDLTPQPDQDNLETDLRRLLSDSDDDMGLPDLGYNLGLELSDDEEPWKWLGSMESD